MASAPYAPIPFRDDVYASLRFARVKCNKDVIPAAPNMTLPPAPPAMTASSHDFNTKLEDDVVGLCARVSSGAAQRAEAAATWGSLAVAAAVASPSPATAAAAAGPAAAAGGGGGFMHVATDPPRAGGPDAKRPRVESPISAATAAAASTGRLPIAAAPAPPVVAAASAMWSCEMCTFSNDASLAACSMCNSPKPKPPAGAPAPAATAAAAGGRLAGGGGGVAAIRSSPPAVAPAPAAAPAAGGSRGAWPAAGGTGNDAFRAGTSFVITDRWYCGACQLENALENTACVYCDAPRTSRSAV